MVIGYTTGFNVKNSMYFVHISAQAANFALYSTNWMVLIAKMKHIFLSGKC